MFLFSAILHTCITFPGLFENYWTRNWIFLIFWKTFSLLSSKDCLVWLLMFLFPLSKCSSCSNKFAGLYHLLCWCFKVNFSWSIWRFVHVLLLFTIPFLFLYCVGCFKFIRCSFSTCKAHPTFSSISRIQRSGWMLAHFPCSFTVYS